MHIETYRRSGEIARLLEEIGGESLNGSGFEPEPPETSFDLNDLLNPSAEEISE